MDEVQRAKNRNKSRVRARVEHVFAVVKRLWGFTKVRYRGLQKNATRAFTALALANIYLARGRLQDRCARKGPPRGSKAPRNRPCGAKHSIFAGHLAFKWLCDGYDVTCSAPACLAALNP